MNKINYKESIDLINEIKELLIINIDENFTTIDEVDFINIIHHGSSLIAFFIFLFLPSPAPVHRIVHRVS